MQTQQAYIKKRMFKNFQQDLFKTRVSLLPELQAILQCTDVNIAANLLTKGLTRILDDMAPIKTVQTRNNYAPHMGENTKTLQARRNAAQEKAVLSENTEDWRQYRSLRNQTTASLRKDLVIYRKDKLCSNENSPADIWKTVKQILNWEGGGPPSQLFHDGRMINKPAAVAGAINSFFIKKIKTIIANIPPVAMDPLAKL